MGKGKSDAALATMFGDPSFPILSIGCTNALSARAECVQHFGEVFSHEASMNARVSCIIPFIHTRLAKLSFNHSIGRTRPRTQVTFINFYKNRNNIAAAGIHSLQHIEVPAVPTTIQLVASDYTD